MAGLPHKLHPYGGNNFLGGHAGRCLAVREISFRDVACLSCGLLLRARWLRENIRPCSELFQFLRCFHYRSLVVLTCLLSSTNLGYLQNCFQLGSELANSIGLPWVLLQNQI